MFGFLFRKKQEDVRKTLQGRLNRAFLRQFGDRRRSTSRGAMCDVAWIIPCDDATGRKLYDAAFAVVTRDVSQAGISFVHTEPITDKSLLIGLHGEAGPVFLLGRVEHSTDMGWGFYLVGVHSEELIEVESPEIRRIERAMADRSMAAAAR